jgi:hypothetical protein
LFAPALYDARPTGYGCEGRDFVLTANNRLYYFAHDLAMVGLEGTHFAGGRSGPRAITGLPQPIRSARWLDNGEALRVAPTGDSIHLTGHPIGKNFVVRIAELTL